MVFDIGSAAVEKQSPSIMIKEEWLTVLMLQFRRVKNRRADQKDKNEKRKKIAMYKISYQSLSNSEMNMIAFSQGEPDREAGVNPNGSTGPYVEIATAKITSDGGGLLLCEIARSFIWTECRCGGAGKCSIVVIVLLMGQIGGLQRCVHGWRGGYAKLDVGCRCMVSMMILCIRIWIGTSVAQASFETTLAW